ncbi:MAG: M28 family peptidase [Solirubrobacterales bacterium]
MRVADRIELLSELTASGPRGAGTDAERRAANLLAGRLRSLGRRAEIEPIRSHRNAPFIYAIHIALALAAGLVGSEQPEVGLGVAVAVLISLYGELDGRYALLRRLLFRRASQNVWSPGVRSDAPALVVLTAHYDTARSGAVHRPGMARIAGALPVRTGTTGLGFWLTLTLLPGLVLLATGLEERWVFALLALPTVGLLLLLAASGDVALSRPVPGANDNASGVVTAISAATELEADEPENLEIAVALTGSSEWNPIGMRRFMRAHRADLDPRWTWIINIEAVGTGTVRVLTAEGPLVLYGHDTSLLELCEAATEAEPTLGAEGQRRRLASDGYVARRARLPAVTITCAEGKALPDAIHHETDTTDQVDPAAMEDAHAYVMALVRLIDREAGRRLADQAGA